MVAEVVAVIKDAPEDGRTVLRNVRQKEKRIVEFPTLSDFFKSEFYHLIRKCILLLGFRVH